MFPFARPLRAVVYLWAPIRILQAKNFRLVQKINVAALNSPTKLNLNEIGNWHDLHIGHFYLVNQN